jgi:N-acyl homoserine lactone hydrolase
MRVVALTTGTVQIKTAMARGRGASAPVRLARTLLDREYTRALPIHAWLVEHPDGPLLIDTGELCGTRDLPLARFHVEREHEIDRELARAGVQAGELRAVVLTHLHGDHVNGLRRLAGARVLADRQALAFAGARKLRARGASAVEAIELRERPFGAFARSAPLTGDARVVAVPVPGHARGQIAVIVVDDDGRHLLIAGDSAYSEAQLLGGWVDGVSLSARHARSSLDTIRAHAREHATVFLPSHDPDSAARLRGGTLVAPAPAPAPEPASAGGGVAREALAPVERTARG